MMKTRLIAPLFLSLVITTGCVNTPVHEETTPDFLAKNELQLQTLGFIFFAGNPMPPTPTEEETQAIDQMMQSVERDKLNEIFGEDKNLWVYATRDTDNDGIRDYRIDDVYGRFMEGDTDIDGDGIPNTLDIGPYDMNVSNKDINNNTVPDHIDWSLMKKYDSKMAEIQVKLYKDHGIILVERSTIFTELVVQVVNDVVTRAFKQVFSEKKKLPTLTTVASIQWTALDKATDTEDDYGVFAMVMAQNATLSIFQKGIELDRFLLFGLLGHELSHNIQFSLDYSEADRKDLAKNIYRHKNFYKLLENFGWSFKNTAVDQSEVYDQVSLHYQEISPWEIKYEGSTKDELEYFINEDLDNPLVRAAHIVGVYSLSPLEWHADHMIAYLFNGMEDYAQQHFCTSNEMEMLKSTTKADNVKAWDFYHGNARGNLVAMNYFREAFPIADNDWDYFTREYLLKSYPDVCTRS